MQQQQQSKATWVVGMESVHSIFLCALLLAAGYIDELMGGLGWLDIVCYITSSQDCKANTGHCTTSQLDSCSRLSSLKTKQPGVTAVILWIFAPVYAD